MANANFRVTIHMAASLHLAEVKAYKSGMVELHYEVRGHRVE